MDINKLSTSEKIISASAIVLLVASFLPWFSIELFGATGSHNGWDFFVVGIVPTLLGLVMLAHVGISNFAQNVSLPDLPWPKVHMIAGIVAGVLILLKMLIGHEEAGFDFDRSIGVFLATLAGIGLAAGGFLYNKEKSGTATAM